MKAEMPANEIYEIFNFANKFVHKSDDKNGDKSGAYDLFRFGR